VTDDFPELPWALRQFELERMRRESDFWILMTPYLSPDMQQCPFSDLPSLLSDDDYGELEEILGDQTWADFVLSTLPLGDIPLIDPRAPDQSSP
jgi:hypothetical protein